MYFNKINHPFNFTDWKLDQSSSSIDTVDLGDNIFHVTITDRERWNTVVPPTLIDEEIIESKKVSEATLSINDQGSLSFSLKGTPLLVPHETLPFGVLKDKWVWCFDVEDTLNFYGMGEKNVGFEKSGLRTKFWNTDVWADFADDEINTGITDPMYASFPILIIRNGSYWSAVILPTASPVFMDTGARQVIEGVADTGADDQFFYLGSQESPPELYLIADENPLSLVAKIQRLCGVTPRPPLWALGYHQSRWGYSTCEHLHRLDASFKEYDIPCDGLWIDIDYMDGYRVFSLNEQVSSGLEDHLKKLKEHGRRVVPILDPGVKVDHAFGPCKDGLVQNVFCQNPEGNPFVGFVWPGASYFPDFSTQKGRHWWSFYTKELASKGFEGFWIDMNDPSTGSVELEDLLFSDGTMSHQSYHNGYGLGMAQATSDGVKAAFPELRPFTLTRSGTIGSSRYGAMWTGDNNSNYHHLRKGLEMVLSLSISGMPFVGSDVGGFGGDAFKKNYIDWFKTTYLLPFMRNHSADGTREQEPWTFDEETLQVVRRCLKARYTLIPYLYQQFLREESEGYPMIRPMIFHYPEDARFVDNAYQFMIGDDLLQAPNLWEESYDSDHEVLIPEGSWMDLSDGAWVSGPSEIKVEEDSETMHLFVKEGAIIPLTSHMEMCSSTEDIELAKVNFLIVIDTEEKEKSTRSYTYIYDDGKTFSYRDGGQEQIRLTYTFEDRRLEITIEEEKKTEKILFITGGIESIIVNGETLSPRSMSLPIDGMNTPVMKVSI